MPELANDFMLSRKPSPQRPMQGLTVLVVEDSRFACEALRQLCLRSGARIRRADCLRSARRHLQLYRPDVVIIDLGLPDGPGEALIRDLAQGHPRPGVILATSGDPDGEGSALEAGADGFLGKPVVSLAAFQLAILAHLPESGPRSLPGAEAAVEPDEIALKDDLTLAARMLSDDPDAPTRTYLSRFLTGVARSAHDRALEDAATAMLVGPGRGAPPDLRHLSGLIEARLRAGADSFAPRRNPA